MDHPISPMPSNYSSSSSIFLISALHSSHTTTTTTTSTFPITAVAIIGILATAFLLVSYYIFVIKCCLNWHRIDLLRRFSFSGRQRTNDNPLMNNSPLEENRGLDEAIIRSIPVLQYKKDIGGRRRRKKERRLCECAVCLNEFQEEEKLRVIPKCGHVFHIDCIDIWLQNNANCPLCRTSISAAEIISSPNFSWDEDYVVIEIGEEENNPNSSLSLSLLKVEERLMDSCGGDEMIEQKTSLKWKKKVTCVGDECIDIRHKDEQYFGIIQPIRRSFSLDSASDPHLHLAVQDILQCSRDGCSSSSSKVVRRSFFSLRGHDRTSRSAVLPLLHLEP